MTKQQETLTTQEAFELLGVSRTALYKMMDKGELSPLSQETKARYPRLKFDKKAVEALKRKRDREGRSKPRRSRTPKTEVEAHQAA